MLTPRYSPYAETQTSVQCVLFETECKEARAQRGRKRFTYQFITTFPHGESTNTVVQADEGAKESAKGRG